MANRFNASPEIKHGQNPLSSGYPTGARSDDTIPPVGLEDIDSSLFVLFDKELPIVVTSSELSEGPKKVPVIFAGGEKWALLKKNKPLRDKNNALILPLITIGRTNFSQNASEDIAGRGINQRSGELLIRRRLDSSDRAYQNLINKTGLNNQSGVSTSVEGGTPNTKEIGESLVHPNIRAGELLVPHRRKNIYETLTVPTPQFITVSYDVIVWTQYTHHMNQIFECLFSSYLPQVQGWKLETPKGYWFVAQVEDGSHAQENNFEDMSQGERLIKQRFTVKVQGYIFASSTPGAPIPVKKYVSAPEISFQTGILKVDPQIILGQEPPPEVIVEDPFLGADDPTLPLDVRSRNTRDDRRDTGPDLILPSDSDPAMKSFPRGKKPSLYKKLPNGRYVKIMSENSRMGETSYSSLRGIDDV